MWIYQNDKFKRNTTALQRLTVEEEEVTDIFVWAIRQSN